jgi:serine/threonine-protein kinase
MAGAVPAATAALEPIPPQSAGPSGVVQPTVAEQQATAEEVPAAAAPVVTAVPQQVALAPAALAPASLAERMRNFVRFYDGGACFFAVPVSFDGQRPRIDGFGSDVEPILTFGAELRRAFGIDADIEVRQITGEQCPAIGFIGGLLKSRLPELAVRLDADYIASGGELRGHIEGAALPWMSLLLVDDDGMVHDVSKYLRRSDVGLEFAVPVYLTAQGKDRNQLIVAVAASRALVRLDLVKPARSAELFPAVVNEADATQNDIAIGIGAFRVE